MKKLLLLVFMASYIIGCSDSDKKEEKVAILKVEDKEKDLEFPLAGGTKTIHVSYQNVNWDIKVSHPWIEYVLRESTTGEDGLKKMSVDIVLKKYKESERRTGTITLFGKGVDDVIINVVQFEEKTFFWDQSSLFFGKLKGKVHKVDYVDSGFTNAVFDDKGNIVKYHFLGYDASNNKLDVDFNCYYDAKGRLTTVSGGNIKTNITYSDHGRYVEVGTNIFKDNNMHIMYLLQSPFVKNIASVKFTLDGRTREYKFTFTGDKLTVKYFPENYLWSECTYVGKFPSERVTEYSTPGYKGVYTENYIFDENSGKLKSLTTKDVWKLTSGDVENTTEWTYNDDLYNTVAKEGVFVYTYDDHGDYTLIKGPKGEDAYTYTRDGSFNWTTRKDDWKLEVNTGDVQTGTIIENRVIQYYK